MQGLGCRVEPPASEKGTDTATSVVALSVPFTLASVAATERTCNNFKGFKDFHLKNGSSQGQNLALTALLVPKSLELGGRLRVELGGAVHGIQQLPVPLVSCNQG